MPTIEPAGGVVLERCSQCNEVGGHLLACDEELNNLHAYKGVKPRFCNRCMIGKKVKVYWPVDDSWYMGIVVEYDAATGEHELKYPDGDREWVKIGDIISAAAAGGGGSCSANNSTITTTESSSLGGGIVTHGHHAPLTPPCSNLTTDVLSSRNLPPPRQLTHPHHRSSGQSPSRVFEQQQPPPALSDRHRPHRASDHHQMQPEEHESLRPDYRTNLPNNVVSASPSYYVGPPHHYTAPSVKGHGLSPSGMPLGSGNPSPFSVGNTPTSQQQPPPPTGSAPPHHHPSMGPPMMPQYGMFPSHPTPGAYGGGHMYSPHHPHLGGPPSHYGMPMTQIGGPSPYYPGRPASPQSVRTENSSNNNRTSVNIGSSGGTNHNHNDGDNEDGGGRTRKTGPKPWSKEEDTLLLNLVHTMQWPMKWTIVAQSLPERTGKQCRERYVNHLNPRLKASDWNPVEDSTIFHLYNTIGSHWAKMSKIIPGRTDNGIKNRFHNIRRQYEREDSHRLRLSSVEDFPDEIRFDRLRKFPEHLEGKSTTLWDMKSAIGVLAAQTAIGGTSSSRVNIGGGTVSRFGPFRKLIENEVELCVRCGLLVPSVHTGSEICVKTGWCQSCTRLPPNVSGNLLRECLNLRRAENKELRIIIESYKELFKPNESNAWPYKKSIKSSSKAASKEQKPTVDRFHEDEKYPEEYEEESA